MSDIEIGVNLEFIRSSEKGFRYGIETAAKLGYKYVEPCVATGYDLLALAEYYHMVSMEEDPLEIKAWLDDLGLKCSAVSAHSPLMRPEVGVPYLTKAVRFASVLAPPSSQRMRGSNRVGCRKRKPSRSCGTRSAK